MRRTYSSISDFMGMHDLTTGLHTTKETATAHNAVVMSLPHHPQLLEPFLDRPSQADSCSLSTFYCRSSLSSPCHTLSSRFFLNTEHCALYPLWCHMCLCAPLGFADTSSSNAASCDCHSDSCFSHPPPPPPPPPEIARFGTHALSSIIRTC